MTFFNNVWSQELLQNQALRSLAFAVVLWLFVAFD